MHHNLQKYLFATNETYIYSCSASQNLSGKHITNIRRVYRCKNSLFKFYCLDLDLDPTNFYINFVTQSVYERERERELLPLRLTPTLFKSEIFRFHSS